MYAMKEIRKSIMLTKFTYNKLSLLGKHNKSFNDLVLRLCDFYKKQGGSKK